MSAALQLRLQNASADYQKLQADVSSAVEARQRLDAQLSENELVRKEFVNLTSANTVYKLIGPVLVQQDQSEARANIEKRLEFIRGEITRVETQLKELEEKSEKKKTEVRTPPYYCPLFCVTSAMHELILMVSGWSVLSTLQLVEIQAALQQQQQPQTAPAAVAA
ncbi:prefoldin subunit 6 [Amylocystis lapponica]|nr:prefoldin subunit 6 [Amylocystis lapponica]